MKKILFAVLFVATSVSAQSQQQVAVGGELILSCPVRSTAIVTQLSSRKTSVRCQAEGCKITIHNTGTSGGLQDDLYKLNLILPDGKVIRIPKENYVRKSILQQTIDKAQLDAYDKYNCDTVSVNPNPIKIEY